MRSVLSNTIGFSLGDILTEIPGAKWIANTVIPGIGDFAKTELGAHVIGVISVGVSPLLVPIVGPIAVGIGMATPGLLAGDDFTTAFTKGITESVERLVVVLPFVLVAAPAAIGVAAGATAGAAGFLSAGGAIAAIEKYKNDIVTTINRPEVKNAVNGAAAEAKKHGLTLKNALKTLGITPEKFAREQGVREDVAAHAINANAHEIVYDTSTFDPATGLRHPPPPPGPEDRSNGLNSTWDLIELLRAQNTGASEDTVRTLTENYQRTLRIEDPTTPTSSYNETDALTEVLAAQNRGAPADVIRTYIRAYDRVRSPMSPELEKARTDDQALRLLVHERRKRLIAKQKAAEEGAKLGQLKFGESAGASMLGKVGTLALLTSPFWILVLLSRRTP